MQQRSKDEKIATLLKHWMAHNGGHAREFREWAERAKKLGRTGISEQILQAAEQMDKANQFLLVALEKLGGD